MLSIKIYYGLQDLSEKIKEEEEKEKISKFSKGAKPINE